MAGPAKEVVVVGGGAVGLAAAYYLRRRDLRVRVLDAGTVGAACSAVNAGWITPSLSSPVPSPGATTFALKNMWRSTAPVVLAPSKVLSLAPWLARFAVNSRRPQFTAGQHALAQLNANTLRLYDEMRSDGVLFEEAPVDGIICAFLDPALARRAHSGLQVLTRFGLPTPGPVLTGGQLREIEPGLSRSVRAGYLCPEDRAVDPQTLTAGLAKRLRELDVEIEENVRVTGFTACHDRVSSIMTNVGVRRADEVLLAAGAGTRALARQLGVRLAIEIAKGYSLTVPIDGQPARAVSCGDRKVACTPWGDTVRLAGILEFSGDNLRVNATRVRGVLSAASSYLANLSIGDGSTVMDALDSLAVGQRTMTPNGLPLLDRLPSWSNVFVSTAHAMLGITLAASTGKAMADFIATGTRPVELTAFTLR